MTQAVCLDPVGDSQEREFMEIAEAYFRELNPCFAPHTDWRESYFVRLKEDPSLYVRWIQCDKQRAGFVIYGCEKHRFLPRKNGCVYEFCILPQYRRTRIGTKAAELVLQALRSLSPAKIQLEIACSNESAQKFWRALGFEKVSERYVLFGGKG